MGLGFRTPKSMILDSTGKIFPDSGFHEQNFSDSGFHGQNFSDSGFHEQNFSDSGIRVPLHWGYTKGLGTAESVEPADVTQQGYSSSPQMTAHVDLQNFTSNDVRTHVVRPGVRCRLQNGVIGLCVESSIEKIDLRLLIFLQRLCTPVMAFSKARMKKSVKSHKPKPIPT